MSQQPSALPPWPFRPTPTVPPSGCKRGRKVAVISLPVSCFRRFHEQLLFVLGWTPVRRLRTYGKSRSRGIVALSHPPRITTLREFRKSTAAFLFMYSCEYLDFLAPVGTLTLTRKSPSWQADRKQNAGVFPASPEMAFKLFYYQVYVGAPPAHRRGPSLSQDPACARFSKTEPRQAHGLRG
jgi:hypothetical protein